MIKDYEKIKSLYESAKKWTIAGMGILSGEKLDYRLGICKTCEFWNHKKFNGTGRCEKCGCSTWAKLRMATEKCPIGKWDAIKLD